MFGSTTLRIFGYRIGAEAVLLALVSSLGGLLFGYDIGQISGLILFPDFVRRFSAIMNPGRGVTTEWDRLSLALLVSLMSVGCLFGALASAYMTDQLGRRRSISLGVVIFIIGYGIQLTAVYWLHFTMGRFVAGLGIGILSVAVPMFQSETSPREIRGAQLKAIGGDRVWRIVIAIGLGLSLPLGIGILFVPESPRWLAARGDWEGTRQSLARLRGKMNQPEDALVEKDFEEMKQILEKENKAGRGSWMECFSTKTTTPKVLYRTMLGIGIHFSQEWTGINYFFNFGAQIFREAGMENPLRTQVFLGGVNVVATLASLFFIEKLGRRRLLVTGAIWQACCLVVFASVGSIDPIVRSNAIWGNVILITCGCVFIAWFAGTWGPMAWVVVGETFPLRTRAKQAALATAANWLGNFLLGLSTPFADAKWGYKFGFVFFASNIAAAFLVYFFLYESQALSLENVDLMYGQEELTARNSSKWMPPGYVTRRLRAGEKETV